MTPWRFALGLTLAACGLVFWWAKSELAYLTPYAGMLAASHGPRLAGEATLAVVTLFCLLYRVGMAAGLSRVGRKIDAEQRALARGAGYDPDLAASLERDRAGG